METETKTNALTDRLRAHADLRTAMDGDNGNTAMLRDAADEIERLRRLLGRYLDETPLGHQPHMIAHEVEAALGRQKAKP